MSRMTEKDRSFGPFTWGPWYKCISIEWSSGGGEEQDPRNFLRITGFGRAFRIWLPRILRPWKEVRKSYCDPKRTVTDYWPREYGIYLSTGGGDKFDFLRIYYGAQTHSSDTTKSWSMFLPWMQWSHVRHSLYLPNGEHFYTEPSHRERKKLKGFDLDVWKMREKCPAAHFGFEDFDGEMIIATCHIEEREWHKGTGWFKWLRYFSRPKISRSLNLEFDHEKGPEKGSWKGGTIGHSTEMRPGETPEQAFKRYCEGEHRARGGRTYRIRYIGPCGPPEAKEIRVARARGWKQCEYQHPAAKDMWHHPDALPCQDGKYISTEDMLEYIKEENQANQAQTGTIAAS